MATTLKFSLDEDFINGETRQVEFSTTLDGDGIASYVDAFRSALLGFGFHENSVNRYLIRADK